jgi:aminopeptidase N
MIKNLLFVFLMITISGFLSGTDTVSAQDKAGVKAHKLDVTLIPSEKKIIAKDEITLQDAITGTLSVILNKNLNILKITTGSEAVKFETGPYEGPDVGETGITDNFQTVKLNLKSKTDKITVEYEGEIFDPIEPAKALIHVRGDMTNGLISPDGVYLSGASGWYPDTYSSMATYQVTVKVPTAWYSVGQGNLISDKVEANSRITAWGSDIQTDGFVLVANKFIKTTRNIDGVDCSTYFYEEMPDLSEQFFQKLGEYLPAYQKLLGPYPFSRFDVVENFFSTGYGMPGYTLLGDRVVRMPFVTSEGSLAHELVHCWWGNYVIPDWDKGNWCEGLTYYLTNYYWNILSSNPEKAREFRYNDILKYALEVNPEEEYPLRKFRTKFTEVDGAIGYSKSAAFFGMIHRILGDEVFFESLRDVVSTRGGKYTTWDDFQSAFEKAGGKNLDGYFKSWLDNKGIPEIKIDAASTGKDQTVNFKVSQVGETFSLNLPVSLYSGNNSDVADMTFDMEGSIYNCSIKPKEKCSKLVIDPDYYIFRRLERSEIAPCLDSVMSSDHIMVILPSGGENDMLEQYSMGGGPGGGHGKPSGPPAKVSVKKMYEDLVTSMKELGTAFDVKYDKDVTDADLKGASIICFGEPEYNSVTAKIVGKTDYKFSLFNNGFKLYDTEYTEPGYAILVSIRNPFNDAYDVTLYMGNSPQSVFKSSLIFFYRTHSYVVYENGNATIRDKWMVDNALTSYL